MLIFILFELNIFLKSSMLTNILDETNKTGALVLLIIISKSIQAPGDRKRSPLSTDVINRFSRRSLTIKLSISSMIIGRGGSIYFIISGTICFFTARL